MNSPLINYHNVYYHSTVSMYYLFRLKLSVESMWNPSNILWYHLLIKLMAFCNCMIRCLLDLFVVILFSKNYAQTLVDADRTSLFLVDNRTNELYARIFDIGGSLEDSRSSNLQKEIRLDFNKMPGIVTVQPRHDECPRDWQNNVCYNEVLLYRFSSPLY